MSKLARLSGILLIVLLSLATVVRSQGDSCPSDPNSRVWLGLSGGICSFGNYQISFNGALEASGPGNCTPDNYHPIGEIILEPTIEFSNTLQVTGACSIHLNFFHIPDGYALEINGKEITTIDKGGNNLGDGDGTWNITLRKTWGNGNAGESAGPRQGSVMWAVGLGNLGDGRWAGSVSLRSDSLTSQIYTPSGLVYSPPGYTSEVDVVRNQDSSLRQVKAPQALADIVITSASQYEMRFYRQADVGPKDQNGLYTVSNQPFVTWAVSNPHVGYTDQLQVSKIQNGITSSSLYTWNSANDSWTLATGAGARTETKTKVIDPVTGDRTDIFTVTDSLAQVVSKIARTYHQFPWHEELIKEVIDPDGAALTATYTYYENSSEVGKFRRLKSVANPDGSWEQYDYDSVGNRVLVLRPWKDQPIASASEATSYAIRRTYSNYDGIVVSLHAKLISSDIEKIAGVTVRKTTYSRTGTTVNGEPAVIETQTSYASATVSQAAVSTRYHSSASDFFVNRVASIDYPGGRKDTFTYEKGDYTTNVDPSLNQFTANPGGTAQRETIIHGTTASPDGIAFKSTKETSIRDQFGHVVLQELYAYTGSGYVRIGWTVMDYDDRGHLTQTRSINGTVVTATWNGDQKTADINENGIETVYSYDSLNRISTQTKKGIAAGGGFTAQADIVTTYTLDAEGRTKSETSAAGGLSLTRSTTYDVAGRVKTETDSASLVTTHTYTNGGRTETFTLPGGATRATDKYLDGQIKNILGTAMVNQFFDYGVNADSTPFTQEFIGSAGANSPRWTKTTTDWLGRTIKVEKPSFVVSATLLRVSIYNPVGQLQSESVMTGSTKLIADKLYEYDILGNQIRAGSDVDGNGSLTVSSIDRIVESDSIYQQNGSDWFKVSTSKTYLINGDPTLTTSATESERLTNFPTNATEKTISEAITADVAGSQTRTLTMIDRAAKKETTLIDRPDSDTDAVEVTVNGLLQSSAPATPVTPTTFSYDALGRSLGTSDPATGSSTKTYSSTTGQLISESHGLQTTTYDYYAASSPNAGRLKTKTDPDDKKVYFNYNSRGDVVQTWGDATYPLEYVFDAYGQRTELHTFRSGAGWQGSSWPTSTTGAMDVTRWTIQPSTGLLTDKQDASGRAVSYTYDVLGRVLMRSWARLDAGNNRITTTHSYDPNTAEVLGTSYSDSTPAVTFTYDRGGRQKTVSDSAGIHTFTHSAAGQLLSDQITGGLLDQVSVTAGYDGFLRRNSLQSIRNATTLVNQTYGYDTTSRLQTITSGGQTATYAYHPTSGLLNTTTFTSGTQTSRNYDSLGRLQSIATTTPAVGTVASYTYTYNSLDQRTRTTREDNSYWSYSYNDRGELTTGKKYWADNAPVAGQQNEYVFDNIGNRNSTKGGGDAQGLNLRSSTYNANSLNQYQQRTVPGAIDVLGSAASAAIVTVNDQAAYRRGDYFYKELAVDNSLAPVYQQVKAVGVRNGVGGGGEDAVAEKDGHVYVPKNAEVYSYDVDGNLLGDGRWNYTWDAENRLRSMEAIAGVPNEAKKRLEFAYDWIGRRIQKKVYSWNISTGTYQLQSTTKFIHDDWNLVAELDGNNVLIRSYVWGSGGLHLITDSGNTYIAGSDGNENVTSLVHASTGATTALYDYDSFGQNLQATGNYANTNPFKFSSKYQDSESGLSYYGHRYYNSQGGRWINRDPSEEEGGVNLYAFVNNDGVNQTDLLGQCIAERGKNIEISVDDAPGASNQEMRTFLSQNNIKTTFFVIGPNAEARPGDVRAIVADGHSLGNHTWNHPSLTRLPNERIKSELTRTDELIRRITGRGMAPNWRPPKGDINQRVRNAAASVGYTRAWMWDVDSLDWKYRGATQKIIDQVKSDLRKCNKQTCHILFHDYSTTVKALRIIIPMLKTEGNTIVNFTF